MLVLCSSGALRPSLLVQIFLLARYLQGIFLSSVKRVASSEFCFGEASSAAYVCNNIYKEVNRYRKMFVALRALVHTLERIAFSVKFNKPVLMVGETCTGKTTLVQTLATRLG